MNWSSKSLGSRFQHEVFYALIRFRLLFLAHALLHCVVFYYTLLPSVRKRAYPYISRRFPHAGALMRWRHCFRLYLTFAQGLLERGVAGILGRVRLDNNTEALHNLQQSIPQDTGCIIVTGHIGVWQMGVMGIEDFDRPVNIVQWINPEDVDKHYFQHNGQENKHQIRLINSRDGMDASMEILAALRRKEIICIAGDRTSDSGGQNINVNFLGGTIELPSTAFLLASMAGVPLIVSFSIFTGNSVRGIVAERMDLPSGIRHAPQKLRPYMQRFASIMEDITREHPYHFFNFYDMWTHNDNSGM